MNLSTILISVFIAFAMAFWPVIGKFSNASAGWIGSIVNFVAAIVVAIISRKQMWSNIPPTKALSFLVIAGLINGVAIWLYAVKVADPKISTGAFLVAVAVLVAAWIPLLNWMLNGDVPSWMNVGGYALAMAAIYFLSK